MINVLIVDDSAFFRNALKSMLVDDPEIAIVGMARDGNEALDMVRALNPDVVTLDVEMPRRDGLSTLQVIMAECPRPVIMVSSLTQEGAEATLKAMDLGALDFIPKYSPDSFRLDLARLSTELCTKVKAVVQKARRFPVRPSHLLRPATSAPATSVTDTRPSFGARPAVPLRSTGVGSAASTAGTAMAVAPPLTLRPRGRQTRDYVAIGVSTGGPPAVQKVLSALPADFPACIFIAQHMPGSFTGPFAKRLDSVSKIHVKEAETGDRIQNGVAYVAPGGKHMRVDLRGATPHLSITTEPAEALYKPSANVLMESIGNAVGSRTLGVMMTGMGSDGTEGMKVLKRKGGISIAQNEASCVVYGMPKSVVDAGLADEVVDIDRLAEAIMAALYK